MNELSHGWELVVDEAAEESGFLLGHTELFRLRKETIQIVALIFDRQRKCAVGKILVRIEELRSDLHFNFDLIKFGQHLAVRCTGHGVLSELLADRRHRFT